ncbi:hypothetical protein CC1G_14165 [Coprinopsis cinerea okayama7|uniref:Uncharacterized protein n=1 Tax=Coprinopsis cinerea (strain Okayama-7 / 130 / ATCC MYA-4618 / FGSC 9003) TaxID=240176 RepID=D6RL66_COPC7|nr:hypothetical protein CC1G_14165 [Coprinopsis cinerea okayama7\|eukprot:XP_002911632.1 hypothetical protein CC1G_14165 [Coprinopsis cinerea okayama7\
MAPKNDDTVPSGYKYSWSPSNESEQPLEEFLRKFRPSMVQDDGTKPWIWVHRESLAKDESTNEEAALSEGGEILKALTEKVESIKNDDSIPVRGSKKTGVKSKKEVREAAQAEATQKLEAISVKHKYVNGKWLVFAPPDKVDAIWSTVATSLISGPLSSTCAYSAKVATSPETESQHYQHIICVYIPDVYDKPKVLEVMKVLLRNHGLNLSGVKSDLYTMLGIDSKHPSGIQSTVWKNTALLPDAEIKSLKEAYFSELSEKKEAENNAKSGTAEKEGSATQEGAGTEENKSKAKPKPKLKKKAKASDPFASSDEEETVEDEPRAKGEKAPPRKRKESSDEEDEEEQSKSKRAKVK